MANRRKDRPVPEGFTRYTGEYEKVFYTVITIHGTLYRQCWPNAGQFHLWQSETQIKGKDVFAIRKEKGDV